MFFCITAIRGIFNAHSAQPHTTLEALLSADRPENATQLLGTTDRQPVATTRHHSSRTHKLNLVQSRKSTWRRFARQQCTFSSRPLPSSVGQENTVRAKRLNHAFRSISIWSLLVVAAKGLVCCFVTTFCGSTSLSHALRRPTIQNTVACAISHTTTEKQRARYTHNYDEPIRV